MTKTGLMVITGNSIAELEANLSALKATAKTGARMGVGGNSLSDVSAGVSALREAVGEKPSPRCCHCRCDDVADVVVEETCEISTNTPAGDAMVKALLAAYGINI